MKHAPSIFSVTALIAFSAVARAQQGITPLIHDENASLHLRQPVVDQSAAECMLNQSNDACLSAKCKWPARTLEIQRSRIRNWIERGLQPDTTEGEVQFRIPRAITVAPKPLSDAWKLASEAILVSKQLPFDQRDPEPYLIRGEVWTRLGYSIEAIKDFSEASTLLSAAPRRNVGKQAEYFVRLSKAVKAAVKSPGGPIINDPRPYWGAGVLHKRNAEFDKAILTFSDAISLDPQNSLYWYSRAIAYRDLGFDEEALSDVKAGAYFESERAKKYGSLRVAALKYNDDLEKLGNPHRNWLEQIRFGDGESWGRYPQ